MVESNIPRNRREVLKSLILEKENKKRGKIQRENGYRSHIYMG